MSDLSRWVGEPGQSIWAHVAGSKANLSLPRRGTMAHVAGKGFEDRLAILEGNG